MKSTLGNDLEGLDSTVKASYSVEPDGNTLILYSTDTAQLCLPIQEVHICQRESSISLSVIIEEREIKFLTLNFKIWESEVTDPYQTFS